jgi:hypothetical protein
MLQRRVLLLTMTDISMVWKYDFTGGVCGKHHRAMQAGYSMTVHQENGTTVTKEMMPKEGAVDCGTEVFLFVSIILTL